MLIRSCEVRAGLCLPGAKGAVQHKEDRNGASSSQKELGRAQSDKQRGVAVEEANPEGLAGEQHRSHCAGSQLRNGQGQLLPGWEPPARAAVQGDVPGAPGTQTALNRAGVSAVFNVLKHWCSTAPMRKRLMPAAEESGISSEQMKCRGHTQDKRTKQVIHSPSPVPLRAGWSRGFHWENLLGKATAGAVWCHPTPEASHRVAEHQPWAWLFQTCKCSNLKLPFL